MKKWLYCIISILIISLSLFLRLYKIENRAPFDWDQNRDYLAVQQIIRGNFTLVGPVAKGEGGFLLGPLYYYLLVPGYLLSQGDPISLPITSAILDAMAIAMIIFLFSKIWGKWKALALASAWSLSFFAIEMSRISWNVALVQLWVVLLIYLLSTQFTNSKLLYLGILTGLSWHIHAVLIPLSIFIVLVYIRAFSLTWRKIGIFVLGYLISLSSLIIFDIRHVGLERNLISSFLSSNSTVVSSFSDMFISTFSRLGKNIIATLTGSGNLNLGIGIFVSILSLLAIMRGTQLAKISGYIVLINLGLVIYLGEFRFPEYYLASAYLPVLIILIEVITHFKTLVKPLSVLTILSFLYFVIISYSTSKTSFSLVQKQNLVTEISQLGDIFDIHYDLPLGRHAGLPMMIERAGISVSKQANHEIIITESTDDSVFIDGEMATDLGWFGGFRLAHHVVQ